MKSSVLPYPVSPNSKSVGTVERCLACEADSVGTVERCPAYEADSIGSVENETPVK